MVFWFFRIFECLRLRGCFVIVYIGKFRIFVSIMRRSREGTGWRGVEAPGVDIIGV